MASRELEDCVEELQQKVPQIIADYNKQYPDRILFIVCTLRSTLEQQQLYATGRTAAPIGKGFIVTYKDGINSFSKHNPTPKDKLSRAVDFGVLFAGKYQTSDKYYKPLLDFARQYGLRSGWDFHETGKLIDEIVQDKYFHDSPHIETKKD